jgi:hypothetical protein
MQYIIPVIPLETLLRSKTVILFGPRQKGKSTFVRNQLATDVARSYDLLDQGLLLRMVKSILLTALFVLFVGKSGEAAEMQDSNDLDSRRPHSPCRPDSGRKVNFSHGCYHFLFGVTSSAGNDSRFGPEIGIGHLTCGIEGLCAEGPAVVMGAIGPGSYFAGVGGGVVFYPAVLWAEAAVRLRDHEAMGYHVMVAAGSLVMPYVSGVYNKLKRRTNLEVGVTAKSMSLTW